MKPIVYELDLNPSVPFYRIGPPHLIPIDGSCMSGIWHEYQRHQITQEVATKNDVLIDPEYAVWSPNQNPNNRVENWYYDDVAAEGGGTTILNCAATNALIPCQGCLI